MVGFNPIIEPHHLVTAFKGIWGEAITERAPTFFQRLATHQGQPKPHAPRPPPRHYDAPFRAALLANTNNKATLQFWKKQHASFSKNYAQDAPGTIYNRIGQFLAHPTPPRGALAAQA